MRFASISTHSYKQLINSSYEQDKTLIISTPYLILFITIFSKIFYSSVFTIQMEKTLMYSQNERIKFSGNPVSNKA